MPSYLLTANSMAAGSYGHLYVGSMSLASASQPVLIKTVSGFYVVKMLTHI